MSPRRARPTVERNGFVRPDELCEPQSYIVEKDLGPVIAELRKAFAAHAGELRQWHRLTGHSETTLKLCALLYWMQGTCPGLQLPQRVLVRICDVATSTLKLSFREGREAGLFQRWSFSRHVADITKGRGEKQLTAALARVGKGKGGGRESRSKLTVHGVLYLTPKGSSLIDGLGWVSDFVRGQAGRKTVRTGLVEKLRTTLLAPLRAVAVRRASADENRPPKASQKPNRDSSSLCPEEAPAAPQNAAGAQGNCEKLGLTPSRGNTTARATPPPPSADGSPLAVLTARTTGIREGGSPDAPARLYLRAELDEAVRCYWGGIRSADAWRPSQWSQANPAGRRYLLRQFQPLNELVQLLVSELGEPGPVAHGAKERSSGLHWWNGHGGDDDPRLPARRRRA